MKVERKPVEPKFEPITITLENEFEARVLATQAANIKGQGEFKDFFVVLWEELADLGFDYYEYDGECINANKVDTTS